MAEKRALSWLALEWFGTVVLGVLPDTKRVNEALARLFYWAYNRALPDLVSPRGFNERLIRLKLSEEARDPVRGRVTDKELLKDHVNRLAGPGHVVPTLAVLRSAEEVDRYEFPAPCVVKPTHSSQEVLCLRAGQPTAAERRKMKYWLWKSYFSASREPNYKNLEHKLIVEPVIGGAFGLLEDVKVWCFHGRPKLIQVDHDRHSHHQRDLFSVEGALLPIERLAPRAGRPFAYEKQLPELLRLSRILSMGFSFVRIDFYVVGDAILVGEISSFADGCVSPFKPASADAIVGRLFDEPDLPLGPDAFADRRPEAA